MENEVVYLSSSSHPLMFLSDFYSPEAKHRFGRITEILHGAKNGVHAFGYNTAESEPI